MCAPGTGGGPPAAVEPGAGAAGAPTGSDAGGSGTAGVLGEGAALPAGLAGRVAIDHLVTAGIFSLDGGRWHVENNVWIVGDDEECVLLDAPHDAQAILAAVGDRQLTAILCTHAHDDHVDAALTVAAATGAPIWLHPADRELWDRTHPGRAPDRQIAAGDEFRVGSGTDAVTLTALHTPGHTWGSVSFHAPALSTVFTGDTLFQGGPGATGRSFSDFSTIIDSITTRLLTLPPETTVRTGHGPTTAISREAPDRQAWLDRGH